MADAWEILEGNSSLGAGFDAWEHLNAQEGGAAGFILVDTVEVELMACETDVTIENPDINVVVEDSIDVEIENQEIEVEVECNE